MSVNLIPAAQTALADLLTGAAFAPLTSLGWIRVTGSDRVRWLNGMVTNNIAALQPGEGCYNFFLNAQGRIQGDCTAWMQADSILLETALDRIPALMAMLDHFIIMDDVELKHEGNFGWIIAGPQAAGIVGACGFKLPTGPLRLVRREDTRDDVIHANGHLVPSYEIWSGSPQDFAGIGSALRGRGASQAAAADLEQLRILEGTPLYGVDIRDKDLPQETNQTRALHFAKGCYLGQEIVERIRSRGAVHRTFSGFILDGDLPQPGTPLHDPAKPERPVGELTSVARIQLPSGVSRTFALGYIRRETLDTHAAITYPGGTATPSALPFPIF
jgi:aminomethyltransferase